jgi:hypothetical protein
MRRRDFIALLLGVITTATNLGQRGAAPILSAAVSRDLPMPASPDNSTAWPSPLFAFDQRRSKISSSSSRPTSSVNPLACRASKRLSTEAGRKTLHARTCPPKPFRSCVPKSWRSNRLPRSLRVLSAITTAFGSAMLSGKIDARGQLRLGKNVKAH